MKKGGLWHKGQLTRRGRGYDFKNTVHIGRKKTFSKGGREPVSAEERESGATKKRELGEIAEVWKNKTKPQGCTSEGASRGKYRCHGNDLKMYVTCCAWLNDRI